MSIAVLRAFISKRKQEHDAMLSKRARSSGKVVEKDVSEVSKEGAPTENGEDNGKTNGEEHEASSKDGSKEAAKTTYEPARRELKPPRVLEVYYLFSFLYDCNNCTLFSCAFLLDNGLNIVGSVSFRVAGFEIRS